MVKIPDIWSILEAVEASFEAVDALGDLVDTVRAAGGHRCRRGRDVSIFLAFPSAEYCGTCE